MDIYPNYFFEVPLIEEVYANERNQIGIPGISTNLFMPTRAILTAMKIRSFSSRGQQYHKKIKDLCDLYSLLWFSERSIHENMEEVRAFTDTNSLERFKSSIDGRLTADCERYLGEPEGSMDTILQIIDSYIWSIQGMVFIQLKEFFLHGSNLLFFQRVFCSWYCWDGGLLHYYSAEQARWDHEQRLLTAVYRVRGKFVFVRIFETGVYYSREL